MKDIILCQNKHLVVLIDDKVKTSAGLSYSQERGKKDFVCGQDLDTGNILYFQQYAATKIELPRDYNLTGVPLSVLVDPDRDLYLVDNDDIAIKVQEVRENG